MRFRHKYMLVFSILTIVAMFLTDPDSGLVQNLPFGAGGIATLLILLKSVLYVTMLHLSRRALFDYLDLEEYFLKAKETPEGAGKALQGVAIAMVAIAIVILASVL